MKKTILLLSGVQEVSRSIRKGPFGITVLCWLLVAFATSGLSQSGANEWTWMGGSITVGGDGVLPGIYGTLGMPAIENIPGTRQEAATWIDSDGHLWLFSGDAWGASGADVVPNDLWEFDPATNEWTWMNGSDTLNCGSSGCQPAIYGTLGIIAAGNFPGSTGSATSWTDNSGHFWLFGGDGVDGNGIYSFLNDLWEFDPSANEWTWKSGSSTAGQPGTYGALGTPTSGNVPGSRSHANGWTDNNGNLWLFGGEQIDASSNLQFLNDLWEFNRSTNQWAWMSGSDTINQAGVYGTLGTSASGNSPGARFDAASWSDSNGNLWLFGGVGYDAGGNRTFLNDLWEFNPSANEWTWMSGSSTGNQPGVYGTLGSLASGNVPGSRYSANAWIDSSGHLWLFGGFGFEAGAQGYLSDLWEFDPSTGQWAWMSGSSTISCGANGCGQPGIYGTQAVTAAENIPGGRFAAATWIDKGGNLWLFGGNGMDANGNVGFLNDLWRYQLQAPLPAAATPTFSAPAGTYVTAQTVTISDATAGATIYYTTDGTTPTTSSTLFTGAITVSSTETLEAIATATGYSASAAATATYTITPPTAAPLFNVNGRTVTISDATAGATIYYTTDGTTPTTSSTLFTGAITVSSTETLEAIATAPGYSTSSVSAITVTVSGSAFELSASPASLTIAQGGFGTSAITVTGQSGLTFNPAGIASLTSSVAMTGQEKGGTKVALTAFGLPLGVSAWFTPNPTTKASLLTLVASRSVVPGTYKLTITATSHLEHRKRHDRQWPHRESCDAYTATTVIALTVSAAPGNGHSHR